MVVLLPLPHYGFDPTESSIPWKILRDAGIDFVVATPDGSPAQADERMLTGKGLGPWKTLLQARTDAIDAYSNFAVSPSFRNPSSYDTLNETTADALLLPGGHDKGMKPYLESSKLQQLVTHFFDAGKPVAAICHGVVLSARSINLRTRKSVLFNFKTTALLQSQEIAAHALTRLWLRDYYRTYPDTTVEQEVKAVLEAPTQFIQGPTPLFRDDPAHLSRGFAVQDRNYLSARWPGDAYTFAGALLHQLQGNNRIIPTRI